MGAEKVHEAQLATMKSDRFDQRLIIFIICCWTLFILWKQKGIKYSLDSSRRKESLE